MTDTPDSTTLANMQKAMENMGTEPPADTPPDTTNTTDNTPPTAEESGPAENDEPHNYLPNNKGKCSICKQKEHTLIHGFLD